jgi:hypothetical protein
MALPRYEFRLNSQARPSACPPQMKNAPQLPPSCLASPLIPLDFICLHVASRLIWLLNYSIWHGHSEPEPFWRTEKSLTRITRTLNWNRPCANRADPTHISNEHGGLSIICTVLRTFSMFYHIVGLGPSNRTIVGNNEIRLVSNESQSAVPKRG